MHYLEIANSDIVLILFSSAIVVVVIQSLLFIRKAWKRGLELGIDKKAMTKAMTNSAIFTILPSLPVF